MPSYLLVSPRHGADVLAAEYRDFLDATGLTPAELDQQVLDSPRATLSGLEGYAGILVGGSPFHVTEERYSDEQEHVHRQLEQLLRSPIPTMFVCYGNSFVAHACGGAVGRTHPEDSGPTTVELTPEAAYDPITQGLPPRFQALTGHTENVIAPGNGARILATGPTCPIQIVRANATTWSCQFHAEMNPSAMATRMGFYIDYGYFSPTDYETIVASLPSVDTTYAHQVLRNFVAYAANPLVNSTEATADAGADAAPEGVGQ